MSEDVGVSKAVSSRVLAQTAECEGLTLVRGKSQRFETGAQTLVMLHSARVVAGTHRICLAEKYMLAISSGDTRMVPGAGAGKLECFRLAKLNANG